MKMKVKICGITRLEDARLALSLGAAEIGFVLAPSPRRMAPEAAKAILDALRGEARAPAFRAIGVFVNEAPGTMRDILAFVGLDAAQVHGDESPEACAAFGFPWYRAIRVGGAREAHVLASAGWDCPRLLVDASSPRGYGGTGQGVGTWAALAARAAARGLGKEFFIAGGVAPRNAASFVHGVSPDGLDVSSGVEESPGVKSREKLEALFGAIRRAEAEIEGQEAANEAR